MTGIIRWTEKQIRDYLYNYGFFLLDNWECGGIYSIIAFTDKENYFYYMTFNNFIRGVVNRESNLKNTLFSKKNIFATNNMVHWLEINKKSFILVSVDFGDNTKVNLHCKNCGADFTFFWYDLIGRNRNCPICREGVRRYTRDEVKLYLSNYGFYLLDNCEYNNNIIPISFKDSENYFYYSSLTSFKYSITQPENTFKRGRFQVTNIYTIDNIRNWLKINNKSFDIVSKEYKHSRDKLTFHCNDCNKNFKLYWNDLCNRNADCPSCNEHDSRGEKHIRDCLLRNKIPFEHPIKLENCRNKRQLSFDFGVYTEIGWVLIEYNGVQHYIQSEFYGGGNRFEKQQINDNIKYQYCIDNNIELIIIPYTDFKNIDRIVEERFVK
jgi:hypothetical protein